MAALIQDTPPSKVIRACRDILPSRAIHPHRDTLLHRVMDPHPDFRHRQEAASQITRRPRSQQASQAWKLNPVIQHRGCITRTLMPSRIILPPKGLLLPAFIPRRAATIRTRPSQASHRVTLTRAARLSRVEDIFHRRLTAKVILHPVTRFSPADTARDTAHTGKWEETSRCLRILRCPVPE